MLKQICTVCGNGYNEKVEKCRRCGNTLLADVFMFKGGDKREQIYFVRHPECVERTIAMAERNKNKRKAKKGLLGEIEQIIKNWSFWD